MLKRLSRIIIIIIFLGYVPVTKGAIADFPIITSLIDYYSRQDYEFNKDKISANDTSKSHRSIVSRYIEAFNTGDSVKLGSVLESIYSPQFLNTFGNKVTAALNRLELFRTYGPLAIEYVDSTENPPIVWTRGSITWGWVGHQMYLTDDDLKKVNRHSIWRVRPVPFPEENLTLKQVADSMRLYMKKLADNGLFSGSITISHQGVIILQMSLGDNNQLLSDSIRSDTRFHIASVTKLITITFFLKLVQQNNIDLDDPLGKWIPEYPKPYRDNVLVRHLITHTSGIELDDDPDYLELVRNARTADDLLKAQIKFIKDRKPEFDPGTEYNYSSEGIDLLGVIMERVTGNSWTEIVKEHVIEPSGMKKTRFSVPIEEGKWALGKTFLNKDLQTVDPGPAKSALEVLTVVAKPSSGLWSTADDIHHFTSALLSYQLLNKAWTDSLLNPFLITGELPKYGLKSWIGLGAQGEDIRGIRTVGHGGVVPGYSAAIEILPEKNWLFTVCSNTGEATGYLVFQRFLEFVSGEIP